MLPALVFAVAAVAVGVGLSLAAGRGARLLVAVRVVACAASVSAVFLQLLPEAWREIGPFSLAIFAAGLALPTVLELGIRASGASHSGEAPHGPGIELAFVGLLVHQVGDGLALGALSRSDGSHFGAMLALSLHTIPVVAVVVLAFEAQRSRATALWRAGWLASASAIGVLAATSAGISQAPTMQAWIEAAASGLLMHVVVHDLGFGHRRRQSATI